MEIGAVVHIKAALPKGISGFFLYTVTPRSFFIDIQSFPTLA